MTRMVMFGLMLVAAIVSGSHASSCEGPMTLCGGDYAAVIRVKDSGTVDGSDIIYKIKVMDIVYHGAKLTKSEIDRTKLVVWGNGGSGERQLSQGYYVVTGNLGEPIDRPPKKAIMTTGGCNRIQSILNKEDAKTFQFPNCLGDDCTANVDCIAVTNAVCTSSVCACPATHLTKVAEPNTCTAKGVDDDCAADGDCIAVTNAVCTSSVCACPATHVPNVVKLNTCTSKDKLRDCQHFQELGITSTGVYTIFPTSQASFEVRCDMDTAGGGWTVIQRRVNASDFYKTWEEYKDGFGDLDVNFWLGNDNIHTLTDSGSYSLRVDLTAPDGETGYATYSSFSIGSEADKYKLLIDEHSGTISDSLQIHNETPFTTRNRDNDALDTGNCAVVYSGAWWYTHCHLSNLNGIYGSSVFGKGLNWQPWRGPYGSMTRTQLAIKRV